MGLVELFVAVLIAGVSLVNAGPAAAAAVRSRDARFVALATANALLALLGALWAWGELPYSAPAWTAVQLPILGLVFIVVLLFLATTLLPRRT